jgi:hypothetical protein
MSFRAYAARGGCEFCEHDEGYYDVLGVTVAVGEDRYRFHVPAQKVHWLNLAPLRLRAPEPDPWNEQVWDSSERFGRGITLVEARAFPLEEVIDRVTRWLEGVATTLPESGRSG